MAIAEFEIQILQEIVMFRIAKKTRSISAAALIGLVGAASASGDTDTSTKEVNLDDIRAMRFCEFLL